MYPTEYIQCWKTNSRQLPTAHRTTIKLGTQAIREYFYPNTKEMCEF